MNSLKTVLTVAALAAVGYVVYVSINGGPKPTPPPGAPQQAGGVPSVDFGTPGSEGYVASAPVASNIPLGGDAPRFVPSGGAPSGVQVPSPQVPPPLGFDSQAFQNPGVPQTPPQQEAPKVETPAVPDAAAAGQTRDRFRTFIQAAHFELDRGNFADVLKELSVWYNHPQLTPTESQELTDLLDQVAGTVIYSRQSLLEPPYVVHSGETLEQIAQLYNVSWQLLAKINGIRDPNRLQPGQQIKVVRGPFHAVIGQDGKEMTLLLENPSDPERPHCYAGRFPVSIDPNQNLTGQFEVLRKTAASPQTAPAIELSDQVSIQAAPTAAPGSIQVDRRDIEDLYDILTVGSRVVVRR